MTSTPANADQIDYWNAKAGETWARFQAQLDRQIGPLGDAAIAALAPQPGERVLDIGCGTGATSLSLAAAVAPHGSVLGLDISRPMLDVARQRGAATGNLRFAEGDAQTEVFDGAAFDAAYSRFGVMFFNDPDAAFANIARALHPGGRLAFVCWRPLALNDWMRVPLEAALPLLPPQAPPVPDSPGPFAFADADRVRALLRDSGWHDIAVTPFDAMIGSGDLETTLAMAFRVGPLGMALRERPDLMQPVSDAVRGALVAQVGADGMVLLPAAVWIVTARVG